MNSIVVESPIPLPEAFVTSLMGLSLSTGAGVVLRIGPQDAASATSTTRSKSDERPPKSDKSDDSPKPESQPLKLLLTVTRHGNGFTKATVYSPDGTEVLADVELPSWKSGIDRTLHSKEWTFTVNTSRKPTSTGTTYSKEELLTLLRKRRERMGLSPTVGQDAERFINEL